MSLDVNITLEYFSLSFKTHVTQHVTQVTCPLPFFCPPQSKGPHGICCKEGSFPLTCLPSPSISVKNSPLCGGTAITIKHQVILLMIQVIAMTVELLEALRRSFLSTVVTWTLCSLQSSFPLVPRLKEKLVYLDSQESGAMFRLFCFLRWRHVKHYRSVTLFSTAAATCCSL